MRVPLIHLSRDYMPEPTSATSTTSTAILRVSASDEVQFLYIFDEDHHRRYNASD